MATPYYLNRRFRQSIAPQPDRDSALAASPRTLMQRGLTSTLAGQGFRTANQIGIPEYQTPRPTRPGVTPGYGMVPKQPAAVPQPKPKPKPKPKKNRVGGLPTDVVYEAMRRQLEDELAATLGQLTTDKAQIPLIQELILTRLGRDQTLANETSDEDAIARGVFRSGVRGQNLQDIGMTFDRQRADVAQDIGGQYSDLAQAEAEARLAYQRGLDNALLELAERLRERGYDPGGKKKNKGKK